MDDRQVARHDGNLREAGANFGKRPDGRQVGAREEQAVRLPDSGEAASRTFLRDEGPRGVRDEVLSGRGLGTPPTTVHKVIVEYTEES